MAIAGFVMAMTSAVVDLSTLSRPKAVTAILAIAGVIVLSLLCFREVREWRYSALAIGIPVGVGLLAAAYVTWGKNSSGTATVTPTSSPDSSSSTSSPPSDSSADPILTNAIKFDRPKEPIPYCNHFTGTGMIPRDHALLIFDREASNPGASYYYNQRADSTRQGWIARNVQIGDGTDNKIKVEISAVLIRSSAFDNVMAKLKNADGATDRLPVAPADQITLTRGSDAKPCE